MPNKTGVELIAEERHSDDLKFLLEMRSHVKKAFEENDYDSKRMLIEMIDDWILELETAEIDRLQANRNEQA